VRHLADCGLEVTLNVTLCVLNREHVNSLNVFASDWGARRVGFSRLVPAGRGSVLFDRMLTREQLKELYKRLPGPGAEGPAVVTGDPLAAAIGTPAGAGRGDVAVSGCAAGVAGLTILPDGKLLPCRRLPVPIGNVRTDSLREVWASSPVLEALRDRERYRGKCGTCSRWAVCRGCRAVAYAWAQAGGKDDFLGDDPQCFFEE
jgi:radical SAM protein with 4Fe4S-binding SPASM domain